MSMDNGEYTIRPMTLEDLDEVLEIERACFSIPWSKKAFEGDLLSTATRYLVLLAEGRIAAYAGTWLAVDEGHVTNVAVHPDFRRRRFGRAIMEALVVTCADLGVTYMTLEVRKTNLIAQKLYRSLGFTMIGVRKRYYEDNHEDALVMVNPDVARFRTPEEE